MPLPMLLYHHVGPRRGRTHPWLTVEPARFERHVRLIRRLGYRTATLAEVEAWAVAGAPVPRRTVLITFDDGYADLDEHAYPVLSAHGFSAVTFVVTGLLGEANRWDAPAGDGHPLLGGDAIRRWAGRGMEFGAHTRTHPRLDTLPPAALQDEVRGSRDDLEALLEERVRAFAYPYGAEDQHGRAAAEEAFPLAFTVGEGFNPNPPDPHALRRTMVSYADTGADVALRLALGRSPLIAARTHLGGAWRGRRPSRGPSGRR